MLTLDLNQAINKSAILMLSVPSGMLVLGSLVISSVAMENRREMFGVTAKWTIKLKCCQILIVQQKNLNQKNLVCFAHAKELTGLLPNGLDVTILVDLPRRPGLSNAQLQLASSSPILFAMNIDYRHLFEIVRTSKNASMSGLLASGVNVQVNAVLVCKRGRSSAAPMKKIL